MGTTMAKAAIDPGLVTRDAAPLLDFYSAVFALERLDPLVLPGIGTIHKLSAGQSVLRVMVPDQAPEDDPSAAWSATRGIRYLTFEVVDVHAAAEAVRTRGGSVALEPFELRPGRFLCQATDPDGNMLEIGQGE